MGYDRTLQGISQFFGLRETRERKKNTHRYPYIFLLALYLCVSSYFVYTIYRDQCDSSLFFFCISRFVLYLWLCPLSNVISIALCSVLLFFLNLFLEFFFVIVCLSLSISLRLCSLSVFALCFTAALTLFAVM